MESAVAQNPVELINEHNDTNGNDGCHVKLFSKSEITGNQLNNNLHHTDKAFQVINRMRNDGLLCDVKLLTDDGCEIPAHRIILAGCSPYFYAIFTNFEERNRNCINLHGIDYPTLESLIRYIYTAHIHINGGNLEILFSAANLLQLTDVRDICCDFLRAQLHHTNCLGIRAFADAHGCSELAAYAHKYMEEYFSEVVRGDEFLKLAPERVVELISSDRLNVSSEEEVFECVISWVNADLENRRIVLIQLMEHVRLPFLYHKYLFHRLKEEPLFENNLECKKLYMKAIKYLQVKGKKESQLNNSRMKPRRSSKVLLFVGVHSKKDVWYFDFEDEKFYQMRDLPVEKEYAKLVVLGNRTYLVGGSNDSTSRHTIDVYDNVSDQWSTCTEMKFVRRYYGVVTLHDCICVVGGYENDLEKPNYDEAYNPITNEWGKTKLLLEYLLIYSLGVLDGFLYVAGGYLGRFSECLEGFERYNLENDRSEWITDMSNPHKFIKFAILDGTFYLLGGKNRERKKTYNLVTYNPKTNKWKLIANGPKFGDNYEVVAFNGKLYIAGCLPESNYLHLQVYSPKTNSCITLPNCIGSPISDFSIAVIDKPLSSPTSEMKMKA